MKEKIAFVVVRYGKDINGGAEYHCRMLAERLVNDYDVEVLTTGVKDYIKGGNDIPDGTEYVNGVLVRRFVVDSLPGSEWELQKRVKPVRRLRMFLHKLGLLRLVSQLVPVWKWQKDLEVAAMKHSVFYSSKLFKYIEEHKDEYKVFIPITVDFVPFYYTALLAGEKSIAIPTMHYAKVSFKASLTEAFSRIAYVGFNTISEQQLGRSIFGKALGKHGIISVGIESFPAANWEETRRKYNLPERYLLYVGRVDKGKVNDVLTSFAAYKNKYHESPLQLVMVGGIFDQMPEVKDVMYTGFVSDEEKVAIIQHAEVVVNPSRYESLSLILLEALSMGKPMLVNGRCAVLKEHCKLSKGAVVYYMNARQFMEKLHEMESSAALRNQMGQWGVKYVHDNYDWEVIMGRLKKVITSFP